MLIFLVDINFISSMRHSGQVHYNNPRHIFLFILYVIESDVSPVQYMMMTGSDLPGLHDYRCRYTIARSSCTVTVHDHIEAEQLCDFDPECRAFVLSNRTSWTGKISYDVL